MKKKIIVILTIIVLVLIGFLYQTFAMSNTITESSDAYVLNISDNTSIELPAGTSKNVYYKLTNTNGGTVKYGVGYSGTNVEARVYGDTIDTETGLIDYMENKFIKLKLINNGTTPSTITLKTVLGYEKGGDLIVPSGVTLVTKVEPPSNFAKYLTWLYKTSEKSAVVNNNITYNTSPSLSLMNDRLGGTTTSIDGGNIRYYGANPNNYIYFNCTTYPSTDCELWRIVGVFDGKVKIVRKDSIGTYSYDNSGTESTTGSNNWEISRLMKLLNPNYESEYGGSLYWNRQDGKCYSGSSVDASKNCNMSSLGLKNTATKNMINKNTWYLRGSNTTELYANEYYQRERVTGSVYPTTPVRSNTWDGYVGLIYTSDYGYSADLSKCSGLNIYNYSSSTNNYECRSNNWLYTGDFKWLLAPHSTTNTTIFRLVSDGTVRSANAASNGMYVYPAVYLNKNISISGGNGTSSTPYTISAY